MKTPFIKILTFLILVFPVSLSSQTIQTDTSAVQSKTQTIRETFVLDSRNATIQLTHSPVVSSSDSVVLNKNYSLRRWKDYEIDYAKGRLSITLSASALDSASSASSPSLEIIYSTPDYPIQNEYKLHVLTPTSERPGGEQKVIVSPQSPFSIDDLFNPTLSKSGSLFRGITVGSNRDLTLNSGFRMQMSGNLSDNVSIVAALTDENSPIQPEGVTQQIQELDKVFVQLKAKNYEATLGDFNLETDRDRKSEFVRVNRKLQGAEGIIHFQDFLGTSMRGNVSVAAAAPRGKYATNSFQGIEGNQGPYRLSGENGERRIIVIAGSERVYINGILMIRGETNDYTIEYASAEIFFMTKRLITNASRITVDFEYTDRQYERNLLTASSRLKLWGEKLRVNALVMREADDLDSPIELVMDDAMRKKLRESASDRLSAALPGIRFVGRDSLTNIGRGQYTLRDTTISGSKYSKLIYAPGDPFAEYIVFFSFFEKVPQDSLGYKKVKLGHFEAAGLGIGNYLPVQLLPLPKKHDILDIIIGGDVAQNLSIESEIAFSDFDQNRFSALDDAQNKGIAYTIKTRYNPKRVQFGGIDIGEFDLRLSERYVEQKFVSPDRYNDIEFSRKWDVLANQVGNELIREGLFAYKPFKTTEIKAGYGLLKKGDTFQSDRFQGEMSFSDLSYPSFRYLYEHISSDNRGDEVTAKWNRQQGRIDYHFWVLQPGIRFEYEDREVISKRVAAERDRGFQIIEVAPRLETIQIGKIKVSTEFQFRREDSTDAGIIQNAFHSFTQKYSFQLKEWNDLSSSISASHRSLKYSETFKLRGNQNSEHLLLRFENRYAPLRRALVVDAFYEFANQRSAKLERVFIRVPQGTGNYLYRGDLNKNGIADENEFELTRFDGEYIVILIPGDQLVPIVDVKGSLRVRTQPARLFEQEHGTIGKILSPFSTETYIRVDEKSSDPNTRNILLFRMNHFQKENMTISGTNILTQDVHLYEHNPDFSFRFRYDQRKGFLQLASTAERSYARERSFRLRWQLVREIGNQTDFVNKVDRVIASAQSLRERNLQTNTILSDFYYRPDRQWEVGFKFSVSRSTDRIQKGDAVSDLNTQGIRIVYAMHGRGQLRTEIEREEVILTRGYLEAQKLIPFEMTGGRKIGKTYLFQILFDYRISSNIQLTVNYLGRLEGKRALHTARAEARAFF